MSNEKKSEWYKIVNILTNLTWYVSKWSIVSLNIKKYNDKNRLSRHIVTYVKSNPKKNLLFSIKV